MASSWPPKKNTEFTLDFTLYKNDGTVIANPGTYTKKISKDGGAVADITASVTEEDTTYGQLSIVLSATEMNADRIWVQIKDDTTGCVAYTVTIYTAGETLDEVKAETAAILADTGTDGVVVASGSKTGYALTAAYDAAKSAASQTSVNTIDDFLDTEVAAILAAVDTEVAAIKAKTDNLPASPAAVGSQMDLVNAPNATAVTAIQSGLATAAALDAVDNFVDTEVGAIKAVTDKLDTALELDGAVYRYTTNALEQASGTGATAQQVWEYATRTITALDEDSTTLDLDATIAAAVPTAAAIADAVWDEATADHSDVGSTGAAITAAGSAGDPWATALPGAYGAGTAGKIIGDNINAPIGTVDTVVDGLATTLGVAGAGLTAVPWNAAWDAEVQSECTDALNAYDPPTNAEMEARTIAAASYFDPAADTVAHVTLVDTTTTNTDMVAAAPSAATVADAVLDEAMADHVAAGSLGKAVADTLVDTAEIGAAGAGLTAVPWSADWDAEVQSECTDALNAYDPPTKAEVDATVAAGDDAVLALLGTAAGASIAADIAAVKAETASILEDTATTIPGTIATIDGIVDTIVADSAFIEKWIVNKLVGTDNGDGTITYVLYDDDGTTPLKTWVETTADGERGAAT